MLCLVFNTKSSFLQGFNLEALCDLSFNISLVLWYIADAELLWVLLKKAWLFFLPHFYFVCL